MIDWFDEIEGVISDIQAGQVDEVDVRTLQRVQGEIERLREEIKELKNTRVINAEDVKGYYDD